MFSLIPKDAQGAVSPKFASFVKWVLGGAFCFAIAPIIASIIGGLVGFIAALAIGFTAIKMAPWFSMKLTNMVLKLIRYEARINPIETMLAVYDEKLQETNKAEESIKEFNGVVKNYENQVVDMKRKYPADAARFEEHLSAMQQLLNNRYQALGIARTNLANYKSGIDRASAIWNMTKASEKVDKSAGLLSERDAIRQIKSDEALKSVEQSMADSFAHLDHLLRTEVQTNDTPAQLTNQPANVIHMGVIHQVQPTPIERKAP